MTPAIADVAKAASYAAYAASYADYVATYADAARVAYAFAFAANTRVARADAAKAAESAEESPQ